ncbi:hypothetical protein [Microterricola viridarii]|uniref:Secreted protein n=1 Tax=Microterricola viridarii TaxID=412690 RepID=A0A120I0I7_9MICO|nr:hypothetical protein [Microterricola viridarii]AMB58880.1 hypothetical protein AWU67_08365 [Microterricola viridarii]
MDVVFWILISLAAIAAASVLTVVLIVRALYRRVRRSHTVNSAVLKSRAQFSRGPRRQVLALELQLDDALDSGRAAIDLAVRSNGRRGDLPRLFRRIEAEGATLRAQLQLMESETDAGALADALPAASLAVDQISDMIRELRASVASGLGDPTGDALSALHAELDLEVASLHAGLVELANLNSLDRGGSTATRTRPTTTHGPKESSNERQHRADAYDLPHQDIQSAHPDGGSARRPRR